MNIKDIYSGANRPIKVCLLFVAGCFAMMVIVGFCAVFAFLTSIHALLAITVMILLVAIIAVYMSPR